jgi:dihydropteroate synthase
VKDTSFSIKKTLNMRGKLWIPERIQVMGIINITPDSFYEGSRYRTEKQLLSRVEDMLEEGADFIDVGGYSSRPGAEDIKVDEELARVLPAIKSIMDHFPGALISIDTFRSEIARRAVDHGAMMVNDISGGQLDGKMFDTIADLKVPYIMMHMRGDPGTMRSMVNYTNLFKEIAVYFNKRIQELKERGVSDIILDPGFGFAKTLSQNYELLKNLTYFEWLGYPLLAGLSRKSMIYNILGVESEKALNGTTVLNTFAVLKRASILRVHDVREAKEIIKLTEFL